MHKPAITQQPIDETIAKRWSPRNFDPSKPVTKAQIIALLEAARWAPSCFGDQPWRFVVWDKTTDEAAWQQAFDCIVEGNQTWAKDAPVLVLVCADTVFSHNQKPNRWAEYDTGAAAVSLCLQAASMGLVTHQMGGYKGDEARAAFAIPEQFTPMAMVAVGYQSDVDALPDDLKAREMAERNRKPLGEIFFNGTWGNPIL